MAFYLVRNFHCGAKVMEGGFELIWLLKIAAFLGWLILIPGCLLCAVALPSGNISDRIGFSFAAGFLLFSLICLAGYLSGAGLLAVIISVTALNGFLAFASRKSILSCQGEKGQSILILMLLGFAGFALSITSGWFPQGDAAIHFQGIRTLLSAGRVVQPEYSLLQGGVITDHAYDAWYIFLALTVKYGGMDLPVVWHYCSPLLALLFPWTTYAFARSLTSDWFMALISTAACFAIAAFYPALMYGTVFDALVYQNRIDLWLLLPAALGLSFRYVTGGSYRCLVLAAALAAAQSFMHQNAVLFYFLVTGGVFLLSILHQGRRLNRRRMALLITTGLAFVSMPMLLKMGYNREFIEKASSAPWDGFYSFRHISDSLFAFDPGKYYVPGMETGMLAALISLFLPAGEGDKNYRSVAETSFILTPLVIYNPLVFPTSGEMISYVALMRMHRLPFYYLAATMIITGFGRVRWQSRRGSAVLSVSFGVMLIASMALAGRQYSLNGVSHHMPGWYALAPLFEKGSVVAANRQASTDIAASSEARVLVLRFNGAVDLVNLDSGLEAVRIILGGGAKGYAKAVEEGVTHVVFKKGADENNPAEYPEAEKVFDDEFYTVFRLR